MKVPEAKNVTTELFKSAQKERGRVEPLVEYNAT